MYCDKCGFNNLDDAKFCEKCGNDMSGTSSSPASTGTSGVGGVTAMLSTGNTKKIIAIVIAVLAVFGVLKLLSSTVCSNMSKTDPVKYMVQGFNSSNYKKMFKAYPPEYAKALKKEMDKDDIKTMKKSLKAAKEMAGGKISYKVTDKDRITGDDLDSLEESVNSRMQSVADAADIKHKDVKLKDAYKLTVEMKADGEKNETTVTVFKIGMKWYSLDSTLM